MRIERSGIRELVTIRHCAECDVCCRFLDRETPYEPQCGLIPYKDRFICSNFNAGSNKCRDYERRPLDCRIYPFVLMWDEEYKNVVLGIDPKCPFFENQKLKTRDQKYISKIKSCLLDNLKDAGSKFILRFQEDIEILGKLDIKIEPTMNKFLIGDKKLFEKYAGQNIRLLSARSFIANYVWTSLLGYYWTIIDDNFCLFCKTGETMFMPAPPLGKGLSGRAVKECFKIMNEHNANKRCSRIEDIDQGGLEFFRNLGYKTTEKGGEYIYRQRDLTNLSGDRYKAKRALCNYFEKNYRFEYRDFKARDRRACLELFERWKAGREAARDDGYNKALLEDSLFAHKKAMDRFPDLGLEGKVVIIGEKIAAYTFGYPLDNRTFIVLFEVADLGIKGLAQFIFREFCGGRAGLINAMDDSGLENLRKVKLSYRPDRIERRYCAYG
ncbi:MAG: DUF2156 domain-containing protein [Candidatus Omnitrophica bacterium]|nr:DUF2156 domain-containing protein [Candidatus Omnitrophota bacterium]